MEIWKLYTNDKLVKNEDGTFTYFDTYGDRIDFMGTESLYSWLSEQQVDVDNDPELEAWIDE